MQNLRAVALYLVFLIATVALGLEAAARLGILKTEIHSRVKEIRSLDGQPYVLLIGDSFSIEATDDAFAALLRKHLSDNGAELVNLSIAGTGPRYYSRLFEDYGALSRPELVIVNYYVGNDLTDTEFRPAPTGIRAWLKKVGLKFYLGHYMEAFKNTRDIRRRVSAIERVLDTEMPELEPVNLFLIELGIHHPEFFLENILMRSEKAAEAWQENMMYLRRIARRVKEVDSRLLINIFPSDVQINTNRFPLLVTLGFKLSSEFLSSNSPQENMLVFCRDEKLKCFDLLPAFRQRSNEQFFIERDSHWNESGNQLAFGQIRDYLEENQLLNYRGRSSR